MIRLNILQFFYNLLMILLLPLLFLRLGIKSRKTPDYSRRWKERLGYFDCPPHFQEGICFHCVSVGETLAVIPLIKIMQQSHPHLPLTITSTTPTGSAQVLANFGSTVFHTYLPFDTRGAMQRFFSRLKPKLLVIVETELWPNLLQQAAKHHCATLLANARLSKRSAQRYQQKLSTLTRNMMKTLTHVAAHHHQDGERFIDLGLSPSQLTITGSIKFDIEVSQDTQKNAQSLLSSITPPRRILVAGSTHFGEDEMVIGAFKQVLNRYPDTLLILVPRHPERFDQVATLLKRHQLNTVRRSSHQSLSPSTQVLLGDTMGELMTFWACADIAFVGGSLINHGGHNPLEPATFAVPLLSGPYIVNFAAIYQMLMEQKAIIMVEDTLSLAQQIIHLLSEPQIAKQQGLRAEQVMAHNRGAKQQLQAIIADIWQKQSI